MVVGWRPGRIAWPVDGMPVSGVVRGPLSCPILGAWPATTICRKRATSSARSPLGESWFRWRSPSGLSMLEGRRSFVEHVAVAGTIAWYDYSGGGSGRCGRRPRSLRRAGHNINMNAEHPIDWPWSDPEFAGLIAGPFLSQARSTGSRPDGSKQDRRRHARAAPGLSDVPQTQ